jgi:hypothetical protein
MAGPAPTLTLGDLYARQGLAGKAREIYRALLAEGPVGERGEAAERLRKLVPPARLSIELLQVLLARVVQRKRPRGGG